jgi:hypothetical protein
MTPSVDMSNWTDEEIRELISLWPTHSAMQIAKRLHRPRSAICGKARRLHANGVLPDTGGVKHFEIKPRTAQARRARARILPPPPPPPVGDSLAMRPCSILELNRTRCHWPLGGFHDVAVQFCGGAAAPGHRYCWYHLGMVHGQGSAS